MRLRPDAFASGISLPSHSCTSSAMDAFIAEIIEVGTLVTSYKALLQNDISALRSAQSTLEEADAASARAIEG